MLVRLTIKNVALIDCAQIEFSDGLNVLSGETGAGKSVIIDSLNFVLGAKADKSIIRYGENECSVTAEFTLPSVSPIYDVFDDTGIEREETLIVTRKFSSDGKSSVRINGVSVTVGMLKRFTSLLVDVHGQSEHFSLISEKNQLELLDKFGGERVEGLKNQISREFNEYKRVISQLNELGGDESIRLTRLDVLNYQINEIESADLKDGEEDELSSLKQKIQFREKIFYALDAVSRSFSAEGGAADSLSNSLKILSGITEYSTEYADLYERFSSAYAELEDVAETASSMIEEVKDDEIDADRVESRLDEIKKLKKKYGSDFCEINRFLEQAKEEKDRLENFNENAALLLTEKESLEEKIYAGYVNLSNTRRECAKTFSANVLAELQTLGMKNSLFEIEFNEIPSKENCKFSSANGFDTATYKFSANAGEPTKPLASVISGGEISRFMLAVKAQTAKLSDVSTFIFDEIDAGISGKTANVVAEKFADIACGVQIIAITHLPQISAMGDVNLLIEKTEENGRTLTKVKTLDYNEKITEIVRLSGGGDLTEVAVNRAKEIISVANDYKRLKRNETI